MGAMSYSPAVQTWTTEHVAEIFLKPVFTAENIVDTYAIDPTVNHSKTLTLANELSQIVKKKTTCGFVADGDFTLGEKVITTEPCAVQLEQCAQEFYDTVFKSNLKRGSDIYDLSGTVLEQVMVDRVTTAIANDIFDLCWFGDTGSATAFYQTFDGWFELLAGSTNEITGISVSTTADAIALLKQVYAKSNQLRAVKPTEKVMLVTDSIYMLVLEAFENMGLDSGLARLAEGGPITFRGIPIESQLTWDTTIAAESLTDADRVVYTKRENLLIGTDIVRPGSDAKLFLDEINEVFIFKANFDLGVQYLFDEYVVYAH